MAVHLKVNHTHTLIEDGNTAGFDGSQHFVINEAGGDYDLRVESDGNQNAIRLDSGVYGGVGSLGIGAAPAATPIAHVLVNPPALTIPDNTEYATVHIDNTAAKTVSGATTSAIVAALRVDEPNITATGTVTTAATLYIEGAPTEGGVNHALLVDAGTSRFDGTIYIGDDADANVTTGLVINQGAADDSILTFKSSDVAHGVTTFNETDTFGALAKRAGDDGGLQIRGLNEVTIGLSLEGLGATDNTAKTTSAIGYIMASAYKKSGTGAVDPGADANMFVIRAQATARFIFDVEGSAHADVEWVAFDTHDDVALLDSFETAMRPGLQRDPVRDGFGNVLHYHKDELQRLKIVNFYDDGPRAMVNFTRLTMLLTGAVRQVHDRLAVLEAHLALPAANRPAIGEDGTA